MDLDIVIVGGGPAGIAAAVWANDLGLSSIVLDKADKLGGQLWQIHNPIKNYPGMNTVNGEELLEAFLRSAEHSKIQTRFGVHISAIEHDKRLLILSDGSLIFYKAVIFATGVSRRKLGVLGEDRFVGNGIISSGSKERASVNGKHVIIIGGGDAAVENALILSDHAQKVTLIHRGSKLRARAEFVDEVVKKPNVNIVFNSKVLEFVGGERLSSVMISIDPDNKPIRLDVDAALIRVGVEPNSEMVPNEVSRDNNGYLEIDRYGATNIDGIYAVGDVANPIAPTIATAIGNAASAVKSIYQQIGENMDIFQKYE